MNNRGQTTIFFTLIISILMLFTFTALEVGRIYLSRVKAAAVVQSARLSIMADYNRELFERYHLLFMDAGYGSGSETALEQKMEDYIVYSLNEENKKIYTFVIDELAVLETDNILDEDMKLLKEQIAKYESTAGIIHRAKETAKKIAGKSIDTSSAAQETETNGVELPQNENTSSDTGSEDSTVTKPEDPRNTLTEALKLGILSFLKPADMEVSTKSFDFSSAPSSKYRQQQEDEKDNSFQDIGFLKRFLKESTKEQSFNGLLEKAAVLDYTDYHFSNGVNPKKDSVMKCETEYILKGRDNDFDNLQSVLNEIVWLRMPVNYAYLLTDTEKKSEALTLAAAICTATNTEGLIEIVKYLLLGCWAYGETLNEMKTLLAGGEIAYIKTADTWRTDLKNLTASTSTDSKTAGMNYEDYLLLLLAKKTGKKLDICYARMLDVMELNLQKNDDHFSFEHCIGGLRFQGKLHINPMFMHGKDSSIYEYYFDEQFAY